MTSRLVAEEQLKQPRALRRGPGLVLGGLRGVPGGLLELGGGLLHSHWHTAANARDLRARLGVIADVITAVLSVVCGLT
ncbi:hypothetical protein AB0368_33775 [Actinoplanes sp. NPDC051475]|uniref:hypothetical protein n=1 Tax=Actinoplanes sp. NPDC051475 TaxID=3157225 RepID=UPI00344CA3D3